MEDENPLTKYAQEIGGVFKLGSGVLGKSAIAIGIFIAVGGVAVWRLHSDAAIIGTIGILAVIFLLWFFPVMRFVEKHPDAALLEGAEWTGWQRFQAAAKGYIPQAPEREPTLLPGSPQASLPGSPKKVLIEKPDEEPSE